MFTRKTAILAAVEGDYGVDQVPTGAANSILASEPSITPLAGSTVSRNNSKPFMGNDQHIHIGSHVEVNFKVEMAGANGAADDVPAWAPLMLGCGMVGAANVGVSYDFTPDSDSVDSLSIYFYLDGQWHPLLGARGTYTIEFGKDAIPYFNFTFKGLWVDPTSSANPATVYSAYATPLVVSNVNTPTVSLHAYDAVLESLSIDIGNNIIHSDRPNEEAVKRVDRVPAGSSVFVAPPLSIKNYFTTAKANTLGSMSIVHGTTVGNIVTLASSRAQILQPTYGDANGEATIQCNLSFIPTDAGDDELTISTS